ncbi:hypothetical protein [Natrinema salaciae]|uniref:hypothetical protein n=1 Tax=Natrinema salaciae TaxID=1186196 RepID=UPI0011143C30|nr:hypothetical protein [Natrinema salaciae]
MNRRTVLTGVAIALLSLVAGYFAERDNTPPEYEDKGSNLTAPKSNTEREETPRVHCFFTVELIESPPENASVVSAEKEQLIDATIIRNISVKAVNSDKNTEQ